MHDLCSITMKKLKLFFIVSLALVWSMGCNDDTNAINAQYAPLTESVYSSVTIQPADHYEVYASVNGILDKTLVEEGMVVQRGQTLFKIRNTAPALNVQNAKVAMAQAKQNASNRSSVLGSIQDEISTARLNVKNARQNYERQKKLWQQDIGTRAEYDARKLAYESAQNQLSMLNNKLSRTKSDVNTALKQAKIQYQSANSNATDFTIKSKILGKVYSITKEQGEIVTPQMPIATLGSADNFIIEMLIDEVDITKIQSGQKVIISLDAYSKKVFEATISKIYPSKNERTQTFLIEGTFVEKPARLYPGLSGEANIIISEKEKVLSLPREFVNDKNEVNTPDGLVKVETGLASMDRIEIISGIDTTTQIIAHEE